MTSSTREDNQKETDSSYDPLFGPDVETETYEETNASVDSQWESESDEHTDDMSTSASEGKNRSYRSQLLNQKKLMLK
ncbi:hypothetical protein BWX42_07340 [Dolosigranulum pigrum]|uniref:Uncharacterized protein n=1 Tax=Dolosigranulum pigrum TaxID=29394 RepID=A0A1S8KPB7_9LACT|nr:hypothetical protein BWX42_07340 [Dolosigranulum pigrum]